MTKIETSKRDEKCDKNRATPLDGNLSQVFEVDILVCIVQQTEWETPRARRHGERGRKLFRGCIARRQRTGLVCHCILFPRQHIHLFQRNFSELLPHADRRAQEHWIEVTIRFRPPWAAQLASKIHAPCPFSLDGLFHVALMQLHNLRLCRCKLMLFLEDLDPPQDLCSFKSLLYSASARASSRMNTNWSIFAVNTSPISFSTPLSLSPLSPFRPLATPATSKYRVFGVDCL